MVKPAFLAGFTINHNNYIDQALRIIQPGYTLANGNMPADFQTTFQAIGDAFIEASSAYANATLAARQFTKKAS